MVSRERTSKAKASVAKTSSLPLAESLAKASNDRVKRAAARGLIPRVRPMASSSRRVAAMAPLAKQNDVLWPTMGARMVMRSTKCEIT